MASAKTWFVKTEFGTVLGPMPTDVLREMVRTGEMVRSDQVRKGTDGKWRPASEISGLFDAITPAETTQEADAPATSGAAMLVPSPVESTDAKSPTGDRPTSDAVRPTTQSLLTEPSDSAPTAPMNSAPPIPVPSVKGRLVPPPVPITMANSVVPPAPVEPTVAVAVTNVIESHRVQALAEPPSNDDVSEARSAPPDDDLIARWRVERDRTREELGTVSLAAEMTQSEEVEDFAPELPADLLDDESEVSASKSVSPISESTTRRRTIERPAFLDQVTGLEDGPRVREETLAQKWDRWRRSLPDLRIAAAVVVVLFTAWWFWPRSTRGIHDRYVAIWNEWQIRRTDSKDPAGWEEFLKRTEKELNTTISYLEKHARASDRESQLLLFIGRDCLQKMLNQPRQIGSPRENEMQILFAVLHDMHDPPANGKRLDAVVELRRSKPKVRDSKRAVVGEGDPQGSKPLKEERLPPITSSPSIAPADSKPKQP